MWRPGLIRGRVLDESGDPVEGVQVTAIQTTPVGALSPFRNDVYWDLHTNDLGEFEIAVLPGTFVVTVPMDRATVPPGPGSADEGGFTEPYAVSMITTPDGAWRLVSGPPSLSPHRDRDGHLVTYQSTFYPGVTSLSSAGAVTLDFGDERQGLDIRLMAARGYELRGLARMPANPAARVHGMLTDDAVALPEYFAGVVGEGGPDGTFAFLGVPPGRYTLSLFRRFDIGGVQTRDDDNFFATVPVTISDRDITNLDVTLHTGVRVSGRVELDGPLGAGDDLKVSLSDDRDGIGALIQRSGERVTFTFPSVAPGRYRLGAGSGSWSVGALLLNGREIDENDLDVGVSDISNLVVRMTKASASLTGVLRNRAGVPTMDAQIVVFPADRARWYAMSETLRLRADRADYDGRYTLTELPAGEYFAAAVPEIDMDRWPSPAFFEALAGTATRIQLVGGQSQTLDLRIGGR